MSEKSTASGKRQATDQEKEVFSFLDDLRESGVTNMFGASPYVRDEFNDIGQLESRQLVASWMTNYNEEGDYEMIIDRP